MTDILLPPWIKSARVNFRYLDSTGVSRPEFGGILRTASRGGDRLAASLEFTPQATTSTDSALERAALIAFLNELEGKQNRAYLTNPARRLRGSFPASELLTNNTFANGTTGWTTPANIAMSVADRSARFTRLQSNNTTDIVSAAQSTGLAQYAPYVARCLDVSGRGNFVSGVQLGSGQFGEEYGRTTAAGGGMKTLAAVLPATSAWFGLVDYQTGANQAGDYYSVPYTSFARCALVDNSPNAFQRSDTIGVGGYWGTTGLAGIADDNATAPDGTTTADTITENSSAGQHNVSKSETRTSAAEDWCVGCMVKRGAGTRNFGLVIGRDGSNFTRGRFNLGTGALNDVANSGDNTNGRAFIRDMGNGWYLCYVVARLTASTGVFLQADILDGSFAASYTGDGTSSLQLWRLGAAISGVPFRVGQTTTAATTGTAQTGRGMYVKGLPASTNGLLLPSDEFEVITSFGSELKIVTAALNSDAAGLGYLQFKPALRGTLADNAPIIIHEPFGRFIFNGDAVGWDHEPGIITRASAEFEEAA